MIAAGYDLEDISVARAGRRHVVRIIVDGASGINLDAVADVSRAVSVALDQAEETGGDLVAGEYQLEVSSPGVDRPLTQPRHWRRTIGRLVKVTAKGGGQPAPEQRTPDPAPGDQRPTERQITGRVVAADDERVRFDLDGLFGEWAYADLGPGRVQVEFNRLDEVADEDLAELGEDSSEHDEDLPEIDDTDDEDVEGEER